MLLEFLLRKVEKEIFFKLEFDRDLEISTGFLICIRGQVLKVKVHFEGTVWKALLLQISHPSHFFKIKIL